MKRILSIRTLLLSLFALVGALFFFGCEKEKPAEDSVDLVIANSVEMEGYIVAGYELEQSLTDFRAYLSKIDISKLEWVEENGRMVMHLPGTPPKLEDKIKAFNEKKSTLIKKFPQIASSTPKKRRNYVQHCIQSSENVNDKLLDLGINVYQLKTKSGIEDWFETIGFLDRWMGRDDYVEVVIIGYADGSSYVYKDPRNDAYNAYYPPSGLMQHAYPNGTYKYYYHAGGSTSEIVMIAHTHRSGPDPTPGDYVRMLPGVVEAIYYDGGYYKYSKP